MTRRQMDWRRARLHGKPSLDHRREFEFEDRAAKWLAKAEASQRRQREQKNLRRKDVGSMLPTSSSRSTVSPSTNWSTVADSTGVPW
jgi:hypothetical protein